MQNASYTYLSLEALAAELCLPKRYLKSLAEKRSIPALDVNGRLRFNPETVQKALDNIAGNGGGNNGD